MESALDSLSELTMNRLGADAVLHLCPSGERRNPRNQIWRLLADLFITTALTLTLSHRRRGDYFRSSVLNA